MLRLDPPRADLVGRLGERPAQVAVEDVPARHAQLRLEVERAARLDARLAIWCAQQTILDRLRENAVERAQRGLERSRAGALGVACE